MLKTDGLLGREFKHGEQDCYSFMCDFFKLNYGLEFPNVARPDNWWEPNAETGEQLNIYMDGYRKLGFGLVDGGPRTWLPGDVLLMAIRSPVANHGAILLPGEKIAHHLLGQTSCIEPYNRPLYRDTTVAVLRHPKVDGNALLEHVEIDAWDLVPERIRQQLQEARDAARDNPLPTS
jgi:cell wall-associated NlpC family hydrolase